jgi:hypothetical protein
MSWLQELIEPQHTAMYVSSHSSYYFALLHTATYYYIQVASEAGYHTSLQARVGALEAELKEALQRAGDADARAHALEQVLNRALTTLKEL